MNIETWIQQQPSRMEGYRALAQASGCAWQSIQKWLFAGRVPPERCLAIEKATGGKVTRYELRPDVFGDPPARQRSAKRQVA